MGRGTVLRATVVAVVLATAACSGEVSDAAVADRLAEAFVADDGGGLDDEQSACVGEALVELIGIEEIREDGLTPDDVADLALDDVRLDGAGDAEELADLLDDCDVEPDDPDLDNLDGLAGAVIEASLRTPYRDAITNLVTVDGSGFDLDDEDRECIADILVEVIGLDALVDLGSPEGVADDLSLADAGLEYDADDADDFDAALEDCDVDRFLLEELSMSAVAFVGDEELTCVAGELDETDIGRILYSSVMTAGQSLLDDEVRDRLDAAVQACDEPDLSAFVEELAFALIDDPGRPMLEDEAFCVADTWIFTTDPELFESLEPEDLRFLEELPFLGLDESEVGPLVTAVEDCSAALGFALAIVDTAPISDEQATCVATALLDPAVPVAFIEAFLFGRATPNDPGSVAFLGTLTQCGIAG